MSNPYLAQITMFGGNFAPRGWAFCDGQLLPINQNQSLFSLIGTIYGGDGRTTFALPDLRGRMAIHAGDGPGLTPRQLGQRLGAETTTLITANLPAHNHGVTAQMRAEGRPGNVTDPAGNMLANGSSIYRRNAASEDVTMDPAMIAVSERNAGSNLSFNNMSPYEAVNFIIALTGLFPSRN